MKKIFTLSLLSFFILTHVSAITEWNISSDEFKDLGTISETTVVNELTIYANSEKTVQIDENKKSLEGMQFTHRLKLGGSGDFNDEGEPQGRVLSFKVTGNEKITVFCMSSSSSEDRILNLAFNNNDEILMAMEALGPALTKNEFLYEGEPGNILLYSADKGVNIYYIKIETPTGSSSFNEWNISDEIFNSLGSISSTTTIDGLTIYASEGKTVDIDENKKTLEEWSFTHRLKLGGAGSFNESGLPEDRVLSFEVIGNTKIIIALQSSSGSADRVLNIAADHKSNIFAEVEAPGAAIAKAVIEYNEDRPATLFLYSPSGGVNIYLIKVESGTAGESRPVMPVTDTNIIYPNPATDKVFIKTEHPVLIEIYNIAGSPVKSKFINSTENYVEVDDLKAGIYIIRSSFNNNTLCKKLIIK